MSGFVIKAGGGGCGNGGGGTKCGRWNPTTEQVKVLTDLFRSGLRTPSTDQIQKISSQLSFYGKIESKNVFYWFQNHKARERQKRRRVSVDQNDAVRPDDKISSVKRALAPSLPGWFSGISTLNILSQRRKRNEETNSFDFFFLPSDFAETNQASEPERVIETLQLFPLNSFHESETEKMRLLTSECKETTAFTYTIETEMDHPPLDLRLSFL